MAIYMIALSKRQVKRAVPDPLLDLAFADACVAFAGRLPCRQILLEALMR